MSLEDSSLAAHGRILRTLWSGHYIVGLLSYFFGLATLFDCSCLGRARHAHSAEPGCETCLKE